MIIILTLSDDAATVALNLKDPKSRLTAPNLAILNALVTRTAVDSTENARFVRSFLLLLACDQLKSNIRQYASYFDPAFDPEVLVSVDIDDPRNPSRRFSLLENWGISISELKQRLLASATVWFDTLLSTVPQQAARMLTAAEGSGSTLSAYGYRQVQELEGADLKAEFVLKKWASLFSGLSREPCTPGHVELWNNLTKALLIFWTNDDVHDLHRAGWRHNAIFTQAPLWRTLFECAASQATLLKSFLCQAIAIDYLQRGYVKTIGWGPLNPPPHTLLDDLLINAKPAVLQQIEQALLLNEDLSYQIFQAILHQYRYGCTFNQEFWDILYFLSLCSTEQNRAQLLVRHVANPKAHSPKTLLPLSPLFDFLFKSSKMTPPGHRYGGGGEPLQVGGRIGARYLSRENGGYPFVFRKIDGQTFTPAQIQAVYQAFLGNGNTAFPDPRERYAVLFAEISRNQKSAAPLLQRIPNVSDFKAYLEATYLPTPHGPRDIDTLTNLPVEHAAIGDFTEKDRFDFTRQFFMPWRDAENKLQHHPLPGLQKASSKYFFGPYLKQLINQDLLIPVSWQGLHIINETAQRLQECATWFQKNAYSQVHDFIEGSNTWSLFIIPKTSMPDREEKLYLLTLPFTADQRLALLVTAYQTGFVSLPALLNVSRRHHCTQAFYYALLETDPWVLENLMEAIQASQQAATPAVNATQAAPHPDIERLPEDNRLQAYFENYLASDNCSAQFLVTLPLARTVILDFVRPVLRLTRNKKGDIIPQPTSDERMDETPAEGADGAGAGGADVGDAGASDATAKTLDFVKPVLKPELNDQGEIILRATPDELKKMYDKGFLGGPTMEDCLYYLLAHDGLIPVLAQDVIITSDNTTAIDSMLFEYLCQQIRLYLKGGSNNWSPVLPVAPDLEQDPFAPEQVFRLEPGLEIDPVAHDQLTRAHRIRPILAWVQAREENGLTWELLDICLAPTQKNPETRDDPQKRYFRISESAMAVQVTYFTALGLTFAELFDTQLFRDFETTFPLLAAHFFYFNPELSLCASPKIEDRLMECLERIHGDEEKAALLNAAFIDFASYDPTGSVWRDREASRYHQFYWLLRLSRVMHRVNVPIKGEITFNEAYQPTYQLHDEQDEAPQPLNFELGMNELEMIGKDWLLLFRSIFFCLIGVVKGDRNAILKEQVVLLETLCNIVQDYNNKEKVEHHIRVAMRIPTAAKYWVGHRLVVEGKPQKLPPQPVLENLLREIYAVITVRNITLLKNKSFGRTSNAFTPARGTAAAALHARWQVEFQAPSAPSESTRSSFDYNGATVPPLPGSRRASGFFGWSAETTGWQTQYAPARMAGLEGAGGLGAGGLGAGTVGGGGGAGGLGASGIEMGAGNRSRMFANAGSGAGQNGGEPSHSVPNAQLLASRLALLPAERFARVNENADEAAAVGTATKKMEGPGHGGYQ